MPTVTKPSSQTRRRSYSPSPPEELWRLIFRYATVPRKPLPRGYQPFEPPCDGYDLAPTRLQTCVAIVRVCRLWRLIGAEFLYEDVRIGNADALYSLLLGLRRSAMDGLGGFGRYVRRLELPSHRALASCSSRAGTVGLSSTSRPMSASLQELLRCCPRILILVRPRLQPDMAIVSFWEGLVEGKLDCAVPLLPSLRRLEWHESDIDTHFYGAGSRNTSKLHEIITHAPLLMDLFLTSDRANLLSHLPPLPSLRALRISRADFHPLHSKAGRPIPPRLSPTPFIPHLSHLILHPSPVLPTPLLPFLALVGSRLRVLELGFAPQLSFPATALARILSRCPLLHELTLTLGAPEIAVPPSLPPFTHPGLTRMRLRICPDEWYAYKHVLRSHLAVLESGAFPGLREIVLHDETRSLAERVAGQVFLDGMRRRGLRVVYEDGREAVDRSG
ncbi:hypothetical protein C8F01DRAFT_445648 [Mycena amicta]|nr:hypothetical protein C8F01DRAFT_445648 [Mycena amicta]